MPKTSNNNKEKSDTINGVKEDSITIAKKGLKSLGFAKPIVWLQVQWSNVIFDRTTENEMNLERKKLELKYNVVIPKDFYRKVKEKERAAETQVAVTTIPTGLFSNTTEPAVVPDSNDAFMDTLVDKAISEKEAEAFLKNLKEFNKSGVFPEPETTWFGKHGRLSFSSDRSQLTWTNAFYIAVVLGMITYMFRGTKPHHRRRYKTARDEVQTIELLAREIKNLKSSIISRGFLPELEKKKIQKEMASAVEILQKKLKLSESNITNAAIENVESILDGMIEALSVDCTEVKDCLNEFMKHVDSRLTTNNESKIAGQIDGIVNDSDDRLKNLVRGEECDENKINVELENIEKLFFTKTLISKLGEYGAKEYVALRNRCRKRIDLVKTGYQERLNVARQKLENYKALNHEIDRHENSFNNRDYSHYQSDMNNDFLADLQNKISRIGTGYKKIIDSEALYKIVSRRDSLLDNIAKFTKTLREYSCSSPTNDSSESSNKNSGFGLFRSEDKHGLTEANLKALDSEQSPKKTIKVKLLASDLGESGSESDFSTDGQASQQRRQI